METIRIGTRGSRLAVAQAKLVQEAIAKAGEGVKTELVILHTRGDKNLDKALSEIGDKGVFVSEFEEALLEGRIDLAVHSAKDLPARLAGGLSIAAVLPRADVRDVLVLPRGGRMPGVLGETQDGRPFVLGTGSRRRQLQAKKRWPDVECRLIRGNVETRLNKLASGEYDGIVLAKAGLDRLGIPAATKDGTETKQSTAADAEKFMFWELPAQEFLPAACQGIIAVEAGNDSGCRRLLEKINDPQTWLAFWAERQVLDRLQADCSEAAAAWCREENGALMLDAMYGCARVSLCGAGGLQEALALAKRAADIVKDGEKR